METKQNSMAAVLIALAVGVAVGVMLGIHLRDTLLANETDRLLNEADELATQAEQELEVHGYNLSIRSLALSELRSGKLQCAYCILESDLEGDLHELEAFLENSLETTREFARPDLEAARAYLSKYPHDTQACAGACAEP